MSNVVDVLNEGAIATESTKKLSIRGELKSVQVYKIPIDLLFYNSQNDRIATWISKYQSEFGNINELGRKEFNEIIEQSIIRSNKGAYEKTKNNIKALGQREAGVVLADGRIIDGNRRFTCLRNLYEETKDQSFYYFEAVILDNEINEREIKILELELQHGQDEKVDYNPIEKLVGIYNDVIKKKILTAEEYAKSIDIKPSEMNKYVKVAQIMTDFLEYINAKEEFYIARELEIDGPIHEIYNIQQKLANDEDKWAKARVVLYDNMLMKTSGELTGDITRTIRKLGQDILKTDAFDNYFEGHIKYSEKINEKLYKDDSMVNTEFIRKEIREDDKLREEMKNFLDDAVLESRKERARVIPVDMIENINEDLHKIDVLAVSKLTGEDKEKFKTELDSLKKQIAIIEGKINETI